MEEVGRKKKTCIIIVGYEKVYRLVKRKSLCYIMGKLEFCEKIDIMDKSRAGHY